MAKRNIPVDLFYASYNSDCTYELNSSRLEKYPGAQFMAVYEAGYFGFWLYDELTAYGVTTCVTPPSLIPSASGNKVKTDRLDSDQLAQLLQAGLLLSLIHI